MTDADVATLEQALAALRRRQRRNTLAGDRPLADVWAVEVADVVAAAPGPTRVADVAAALGVDPSQASRRVSAAVAAGLVRRGALQNDGRASVLTLTGRGRRELEQIRARRRDLAARATRQWSATDRRRLAILLQRFVDDLDGRSGA